MQAKLRRAFTAGLVGAVFAGAVMPTGLAAFFLAGSSMAAMRIDGRAALPPARAANPLLHNALARPDVLMPRGFSTGEKRNIEHAIRMQIRAYAARDADQAFAQLAPSTQRFFDQPDKFLRSIAQDVPTMLDARRFAFLGVERTGSRILQQVLITDSTEREWLAEFRLEQQENGEWRIKGCTVRGTPGQQAQSSSGGSEAFA